MNMSAQQAGEMITSITELKQFYESGRQQMQPFLLHSNQSNRVELEVGAGKQFGHPAEAADHINNSIFARSVLWVILIDAGIYRFPLAATRVMYFDRGIYFEIIGAGADKSEVVLELNSEYHDWFITAINGSQGVIKNLTIKDPRGLDNARINRVNGRNHVNNNAGGIVHGAVAKRNSSLIFDYVHFQNCWHTVGADDHSEVYIYNCTGTNVVHGPYSWSTSNIYSNLCDWAGVGASGGTRIGNGFSMAHGGLASCQGINIRGFQFGVYAQWGANVHFNRHHGWGGDDGRTVINEVGSKIEDCDRGLDVHWGSTAGLGNIAVNNITSHVLHATQNSSVYMAPTCVGDGAASGINVRHGTRVVANRSVWRNITGKAFDAYYNSEIHAAGTAEKFVNVGTGYSPTGAFVAGNYGSYIYR